MSWVEKLRAFFDFQPKDTEGSDALRRTEEQHAQAIQKADRLLEDYRRQDGRIKIIRVRR